MTKLHPVMREPEVREWPVVGRCVESAFSMAVGLTPWFEWSGEKVQGVCRVADKHIDVLAIAVAVQRQGICRAFFRELQDKYVSICVWEIDNPILLSALVRWGFRVFTDDIGDSTIGGIPLQSTGMRWEAVAVEAEIIRSTTTTTTEETGP